jgi:hypothetical protein
VDAKAPPAKDEEEEEVDLFGDDDEEDAEMERVKAERVAAYNAKKANKPKAAAKVSEYHPLVLLRDFSALSSSPL